MSGAVTDDGLQKASLPDVGGRAPLQHSLLGLILQTPPTQHMGIPASDCWSLRAIVSARYVQLERYSAWPEAIFLLPLWWLHAWVQEKRRKPAVQAHTVVDFQARQLLWMEASKSVCLELSSEYGILVHHQSVEVTHPVKGPQRTLYVAPVYGLPEDLQALHSFAQTLAERLGLRVVGLRGHVQPWKQRHWPLWACLLVWLALLVGGLIWI